MTDQPDSAAQASYQGPGAAQSRNGTKQKAADESLAGELLRDEMLILRSVETIEARTASIEIGVAVVAGLVLLTLATLFVQSKRGELQP